MKRLIVSVSILSACMCMCFAAQGADNKPTSLSGVVPVQCQPKIPHDSDPTTDAMLDKYREKDISPFEWNMTKRSKLGRQWVYDLTFPSPIKTKDQANNTVYCEYFPAIDVKGKRPAILVLHILDGNFFASRTFCYLMARQGFDALLVKLPYYGQRRPAGMRNPIDNTTHPSDLCDFITQSVMDIRRAKAWLLSRDNVDKNRIGIIGFSLGGFATAITCGVDAGFQRAATIVAGGMFSEVVTNGSRPTRHYLNVCRKNGFTGKRLDDMLKPYEPITYSDRMKNTQLLMVNGTRDSIVPASCARKLADATGAFQIWYPGGHLWLVSQIGRVVDIISKHFGGDDWSTPSEFFAENSKYPSKQVTLDDVLKKP